MRGILSIFIKLRFFIFHVRIACFSECEYILGRLDGFSTFRHTDSKLNHGLEWRLMILLGRDKELSGGSKSDDTLSEVCQGNTPWKGEEGRGGEEIPSQVPTGWPDTAESTTICRVTKLCSKDLDAIIFRLGLPFPRHCPPLFLVNTRCRSINQGP
jgi:hypothetical protein